MESKWTQSLNLSLTINSAFTDMKGTNNVDSEKPTQFLYCMLPFALFFFSQLVFVDRLGNSFS